jgi:tRNA pseudouridine55 synthase
VVDRVEALVAPARAGHAGTLDPLATGVLLVAIGRGTRLVPYLQKLAKRYRARFLLGFASDTEDVEGQVRAVAGAEPSRDQLEEALPGLCGEVRQRPPNYSAVKLRGRRAYQLARRGARLQLAERPVQIHALSVIDYHYPNLTLDILCGAGTYVRALGRDLAASLGTEAVMAALERSAIGDFTLATAINPDMLTAENLAEQLLSPAQAVGFLPSVRLTAQEEARLVHGRSIHRPGHGLAGDIAALSEDGRLIAIVVPCDHDQLRPVRGFQ